MEPRRRFRFLKELSEGAFGKVYLAEMVTGENFSSVVAIKLLHGKWAGHQEIVQRSRDEARVLGLIHHRNIIRVEDLTSINGQCAIVMEYLDGVDLKTLITWCRDAGGHVPRKVVFEVAAAVASALEAAYYGQPLQGGEPLHVIHRDIKPSNVMLTTSGDIKVLDFGTAQARFDEREAHTQALAFGSAAYMAPERLLGDPDNPRGDVFSLGVTLYELLSAQAYGKIHIRPEKFEKVLSERVNAMDLSDLDSEQAEHVRQVLRLVLAYEPDDRPTAGQVVQLAEALSEEINDGSIRRFCREVVQPCKQQLEPHQDASDPLTGSTLFEDSNLLFRREAGDPDTGPTAPEDTWIEDGPQDPAASAPTPQIGSLPAALPEVEEPEEGEDTAEEPFPAAASVDEGLFVVPPELALEGDTAGEEELEAPEDPPQADGSGPIARAAERSGPQPRPSPAPEPEGESVLAGGPTVSGPIAQGPTISGPVATGPTTSGPRKRVDGRPAPPPVASIVPGLGADSSGPRQVREVEAPPKKGGGIFKFLVVAVLLLGVAGVAGTALVMKGLMGGDADPPPPPDSIGQTPPPDPGIPSKYEPGRVVELGAVEGGAAVVRLIGTGQEGEIELWSTPLGLEKLYWSGEGTLELRGLRAGSYNTKLSLGSTRDRPVIEVEAGKACDYQLRTEGTAVWERGACQPIGGGAGGEGEAP